MGRIKFIRCSARGGLRGLPVLRTAGLGGVTLLVGLLSLALPARAADAPPDAVIEKWDEAWTLAPDGTQEYSCCQHVQLNNDRAHGEFADVRLSYRDGIDELQIVTARVRRPDGTFRELPDYAHVEVGPSETTGWPAFAAYRQHVLVMSGIETGCVVELEYRIKRPRGGEFAADVRLDHRYAVKERSITVNVPKDVKLGAKCLNVAAGQVQEATKGTQYRWELHNLPAAVEEPHAPAWVTRCPRLVFSAEGDADTWVQAAIGRIGTAAAESGDVARKLAQEWTEGCSTAADKLRALQTHFAATFNLVHVPLAVRPAELRPAAQVIESCYGSAPEAAAALVALARAAGVDAVPALLVDDEKWVAEAPQESMLSSWVVALNPGDTWPAELPDDALWSATSGAITRDAHWAGSTLLALAGRVVVRHPLPAWTAAEESRCAVGGKLELTAAGAATGEFHVRLTGFFANTSGLRTNDAQKTRVGAVLAHVVPGLEITALDVAKLRPGELDAVAKVKRSKPLDELDGGRCLQLADSGPASIDVVTPLTPIERKLPLALPGPFEEEVNVSITWPADWAATVTPKPMPTPAGAPLAMQVEPIEHGLRIQRAWHAPAATVPPEAFTIWRNTLADLAAEPARTLIIRPAAK